MHTTKLSPLHGGPPHCPNPNCKYHMPQHAPWPVVRFGHFRRLQAPRVIQRYRCRACGRCFSDQSFAASYWLKRADLLLQVHKLATTGAANRQIARSLAAAPATVDNLLARLGRHCLLFHRHIVADLSPRRDISLDGLVTFEHSQFLPYELVAVVDRPSSFVLHLAEAERRRSGTMTEPQRRKRQLLERLYGRPDPDALTRACAECLQVALRGSRQADLYTDKHKAYPPVVARMTGCTIRHEQIDSRAPRTAHNPLFEVNLLDMLLRHCLKDHTRETIAFGKRRANSLYRAAVFIVWRNCIKLRRERRCRQTPAMAIGALARRLTEQDVLSRRLFVGHAELTPLWEDYYWRRLATRVLKVNRVHALRYAA